MDTVNTLLEELFQTGHHLGDKTHHSPLSPDVKTLKPFTSGGIIVREVPDEQHNAQTKALHKMRETLVRYLCPDEKYILFPSSSRPSKQDIEARGQFWISQEENAKGSVYDFDVRWTDLLENESDKTFVQSRAETLMEALLDRLISQVITLPVKRHACGIIFEFLDLFFSLANSLNLFVIDWDFTNPQESLTYFLEEKHLPEKWTTHHKESSFGHKLSKTSSSLIYYGSPREAYVCFTSLFHKASMGLPGRLFILPLFAQVLTSLTSKQASFLMSVNTSIYSRVLTDTVYLTKAEESLRDFSLKSCDSSQHSSSQYDTPPFYLEWLVGSSLIIVRYLKSLGTSRLKKQPSDFYGVGPTSCTALVSKTISFLGLAFQLSCSDRNSTFGLTGLPDQLEWSPFDSPSPQNVTITSWTQRLQYKALWCLFQLLTWFGENPKSCDGAYLIENTNVVSPLDDGSGELEITPVNYAVVACFCCFQHCLSCFANTPKVLPLILSPHRLMKIGLSNAYVLLTAGTCAWRNQPDVDLQNRIQTCLMCDTCHPHLFSSRQRRLLHLGLSLFFWTCDAPHVLSATPSSFFDTLHGFSLRPHHLLHQLCHQVLQGLHHMNQSQLAGLYHRTLTHCCQWLKRYAVPLQLHILYDVYGQYKALDEQDQYPGLYLTILLRLFKMQLGFYATLDYSFTEKQAQLLASLIQLFCRAALPFDSLRRLDASSRSAVLLELLNGLKFFFECPQFHKAATLVKGTPLETPTQRIEQQTGPSVKHLLDQLATQIDLEQSLAQKDQFIAVHQLIPFVLHDVRLFF